MPVVLGDNLTLEDNKLSAVYKELYAKLNKAYAWTNTQISGSGGSISCYANNLNHSDYITCDNSDKFIISSSSYSNCYILNGEIYINKGVSDLDNYKFGSNNNWKELYINSISYTSSTNYTINGWAINSLNELYYIYERNNNGTITHTETQIGTETGWSNLSYSRAINNGKLYSLSSSTATQIGTDTNWTFLGKLFDNVYISTSYYFGINNGYVYKFDSSTPSLYQTSNEIKFFACPDSGYNFYQDINDNIYLNNTFIANIPNIKKFIPRDDTWGSNIIFITNDGKAGIINTSRQIKYLNENIFWKDAIVSTSCSWISGKGGYTSYSDWTALIAIGDGKLYFIEFDGYLYGTLFYTILDDNSNYQSIKGTFNVITLNNTTSVNMKYSCYAFNSADEMTTINTIYTTKHPQNNDKMYKNMNLTSQSNVTNINLPYISDGFLIYTRDPSRDSYFTKIPPASIHETVSAMDLLNATNPNN